VLPAGKGSRFEENVRDLLTGYNDLASILLPLFEVWGSMRPRAAELGRQLVADAGKSEACQLLMSIPGVGAITATSFATAIEDPDNFRKSRSVRAGSVSPPDAKNQVRSIVAVTCPGAVTGMSAACSTRRQP
jgi:transposase